MLEVPVKVPSGTYNSTEFSDGVSQECQNTIIDSGQTLNGSNLFQQKEAILRYSGAGQQYVDSGGANTYVITSIQPSYNQTSYVDGMIVNFVVGNTNTGTSTINVNALGVKPVVNIVGDPVGLQTLIGGFYTTLRYDLSADNFSVLYPRHDDATKAYARGSYVGPQTPGNNPVLQREFNIASIVSVNVPGGVAWQVTFTINIDTPLILYTPYQTNAVDNSGVSVNNVNDAGFQMINRDATADPHLDGFMFTVI